MNHWATLVGIERQCTVHSLRHTFAALLYKSTGDIRLVQAALGHKRVATTEIYTRIPIGRVQKAVQKVSAHLATNG